MIVLFTKEVEKAIKSQKKEKSAGMGNIMV